MPFVDIYSNGVTEGSGEIAWANLANVTGAPDGSYATNTGDGVGAPNTLTLDFPATALPSNPTALYLGITAGIPLILAGTKFITPDISAITGAALAGVLSVSSTIQALIALQSITNAANLKTAIEAGVSVELVFEDVELNNVWNAGGVRLRVVYGSSSGGVVSSAGSVDTLLLSEGRP